MRHSHGRTRVKGATFFELNRKAEGVAVDIEQLRSFVEVVRQGSFSEAARSLSLSQPGVSRRIRKLEEEIGAELLRRTGGALSPTRLGLEFLRFAERVLEEHRRFLSAASEAVGGIRGALHISASTTPGEYLLPDLIAAFSERHPGVSASLHVMESASVEACVEARNCDLGFLGRPPRPGILVAHPVWEDEIVLAVPRAHPLARYQSVPVDRLEGEAFIHRSSGSGTRTSLEEALQLHGVRLPSHRTVMESNSVRSQLSAIASGRGVGFVSRYALAGAEAQEIRAVRLQGLSLRRTLYMIHHDDRVDEPFLAFIRFVQEHANTGRLSEPGP